MSRSKDAWADDPFDTWNADAPLQQERNDIADLGTDHPHYGPMNETEAAKALTAWEQRLREERDGRDLPPEPGDGLDACPYCDSTGGYESVGFGPDAPFVRCRECGHMVTRG